MQRRPWSFLGVLGLALAMPLSLAAQEGAFTTELGVSFSYEGGKTERPLVAVLGVPYPGLFYRGDSTAHGLGVSATRYLHEVPDDGATPLELLPFVARLSSLSAGLSLTQTSRDSFGTSRGGATTLESKFTGDQSTRAGAIDVEWYASPSWALRLATGTVSLRATEDASTVESPSGNGDLARFGTRSTVTDVSAGVVRRFGPETSLSLSGSYAYEARSRSEETVFSGGGILASELELTARTWGVALSGRTLLLDRRLALDGGGSYSVRRSDFDQTAPSAVSIDSPRSIVRNVALEATYFPWRCLGAGAGIAYGARSDVGGLDVKSPSVAAKTVTVSASVRWFPRPRTSVALRVSRKATDTVTPPATDTFQRFEDTLDRVELTGSIRF